MSTKQDDGRLGQADGVGMCSVFGELRGGEWFHLTLTLRPTFPSAQPGGMGSGINLSYRGITIPCCRDWWLGGSPSQTRERWEDSEENIGDLVLEMVGDGKVFVTLWG